MEQEQSNLVDRLFNEKETAELLGVKINTLAKWRCYGKGPSYIKVGRCIRYPFTGVNAFLKSNLVPR